MKAKFLVCVALLGAGITSCEKDLDNPTGSVDQLATITKSNSVQKVGGVLIFPDTAAVKNHLNTMESNLQAWDIQFENTYGHLSEIEIDSIIESIGYDEEQPLSDFESSLGFSSLRTKIKNDEENWLLNTAGEKIEDDPDNHYIVDEVVRSILNVYSEIGIGRSLYKFVENGYYEVTDGNFSTLRSLRSIPIDITGMTNVLFFSDGDMKSGCNSMKSKADFKKSGSKRIKWVVSHMTYPWGRDAIAKTKNYKKKNNRWKKYKSYCEAQAYGDISGSSGNCSSSYTFNTTSGYYVFQNNKKKVKHKMGVSTKTKSGWVKGYHKGAGGITHTSTLTW
jgi:hypothetical protein